MFRFRVKVIRDDKTEIFRVPNERKLRNFFTGFKWGKVHAVVIEKEVIDMISV